MLKKQFKIIEDVKGRKEQKLYFADRKYEILSDVFDSEVDQFEDLIEENICSVLEGKCDKKEYDGNIFGVVIYKDKTDIIDLFAEADEDDIICSLDTKELLEIIKERKRVLNKVFLGTLIFIFLIVIILLIFL